MLDVGYVEIHRLEADGISYRDAIDPFFEVPDSIEEQLIAREEEYTESLRDYLVDVVVNATPQSSKTIKLAYALLTYYLSGSDDSETKTVIEVLNSDNWSDVLAQRISTAKYTPQLASLIAKNAQLVEDAFGSSIADRIVESVVKQYPSAEDVKPHRVSVHDFSSYYLE